MSSRPHIFPINQTHIHMDRDLYQICKKLSPKNIVVASTDSELIKGSYMHRFPPVPSTPNSFTVFIFASSILPFFPPQLSIGVCLCFYQPFRCFI